MSQTSPVTVSALNSILFGAAQEDSKDSLYQEISTYRLRIAQAMEKLNALPSMESAALTPQNIDSVVAKWGNRLHVGTEENKLSITFNPHHVNYLYGPLQALSTIANNAIVYQTAPIHTTNIKMGVTRTIEISNANPAADIESKLNRESSYAAHALASRSTHGLRTPHGTGVTLRNSSHEGMNICHPHAQGSPNKFSSICYGNNKWAEALSTARSGVDAVSAIDRAAIWITSANMNDMYGNLLTKYVVVPAAEQSLPAPFRRHIDDLMHFAVEWLYVPMLSFVADHHSHDLEGFNEDCRTLSNNILHEEETFNRLLGLDALLGLVPTGSSGELAPTPANWALFSLRAMFTNPVGTGGCMPNVLPYAEALLASARKIYALWLLCNSRLLASSKQCLLNSLRVDAYTPPYQNIWSLDDLTTMLNAPKGLYTVCKHYTAATAEGIPWLDY